MYTLTISKPKKQENGTYEGKIYTEKKQQLKLFIKDAYIIKVNTINDSEGYMYLKQHNTAKDMYDLNNKVTDIVKDNCYSWFRINLSDELIEDYCCNNVMYDKKYGQIMKFKCVNDIQGIPKEARANLNITLQCIRFYKQKFVLEWIVNEVEPISCNGFVDIDEDSFEEEEIPCPNKEEIDALKISYLDETTNKIKEIENAIEELKNKRISLCNFIEKLNNANDFAKISRVCDELDILLD